MFGGVLSAMMESLVIAASELWSCRGMGTLTLFLGKHAESAQSSRRFHPRPPKLLPKLRHPPPSITSPSARRRTKTTRGAVK